MQKLFSFLSRWSRNVKRPQRRSSYQLVIEDLESRTLLSSTASPHGLGPTAIASLDRADRLAFFPSPPAFSGGRQRFETDPTHYRRDSHGVLLTYQSTQHAWMYNPTNIARYALGLYASWREGDDSARPVLFANARWLLLNARSAQLPGEQHFADYPLPVGEASFHIPVGARSALTAGLAVSALYVGGLVSGSAAMERLARALLPGFATTVQQGGYQIKLAAHSTWYEEYAFPSVQPPRVLNGHMIAVLQLQWYASQTHNPQARQLAQLGLAGLQQALLLYNDEPLSAYDLERRGQILGYHESEVNLLRYFYQLTGIDLFRRYADAWQVQTERFLQHQAG